MPVYFVLKSILHEFEWFSEKNKGQNSNNEAITINSSPVQISTLI